MIVKTPLGSVPKSLLGRFCNLAGLKYDQEYQEWMEISERVKAWSVNKNNERKSNEDHLVRREIFLPIRSFNMQLALDMAEESLDKLQGQDPGAVCSKAIELMQTKFTGGDGNPRYIPEAKSPMDEGKSTNYSKLLEAAEKNRRKRYERLYVKERVN